MFLSGRRYLVLWLPHWPAERWLRAFRRRTGESLDGPFALIASGQGGIRLAGMNAAAQQAGLAPDMTLADARALLPGLAVAEAEPEADRKALGELADWCSRYAPWTATDGMDGIRIDITGSAHLLGGEAALLSDLLARLAAIGLSVRGTIAETPGAGWAAARYGKGGVITDGDVAAVLANLPVAALRLDSGTVQALSRVGVRRIGELACLPRAPLALRFGAETLRRLDQAFGRAAEPISPQRAPAQFRVRLAFAEPVARREDIETATRHLLEALTRELEDVAQGVRQLDLVIYRVDGDCRRIRIGTATPNRTVAHLLRLLREHFDRIDPGFGIEVMALEAHGVQPMIPQQGMGEEEGALDTLVDRLRNHLGPREAVNLIPVDSHVPERALAILPAGRPGSSNVAWPSRSERPVALLAAPERIEAAAGEPEEAPGWFIWRRVVRTIIDAEGPERIAPEWWRLPPGMETRDYWRLTDTTGRRYWLYRDPAGWYLQGLFA